MMNKIEVKVFLTQLSLLRIKNKVSYYKLLITVYQFLYKITKKLLLMKNMKPQIISQSNLGAGFYFIYKRYPTQLKFLIL